MGYTEPKKTIAKIAKQFLLRLDPLMPFHGNLFRLIPTAFALYNYKLGNVYMHTFYIMCSLLLFSYTTIKTNSVALSPQAIYTD
jgi:hypothetical protein